MRTSRAGSSTRKAGFTLIELVVVMVLLGLFALLTIPLFGETGTSKLGYSARRLSGTVKYLFNEAALTGREHRLIYNLDRDSYRAQRLEEDGTLSDLTGPGRETKLAGEVRFRDLQLPGRGTFTTGEITVRIHPAGWIEETRIHLAEGPEQLTLQIMPLTGVGEILDENQAL